MLQAVLRLFVISVSTIILAFLAVFILRWIGSHQHYQAPPHAWFEKDFWWIHSPKLEDLCNAKEVQTLVPDPQWIIRVPVKRIRIDEWAVPCEKPRKLDEFLSASVHQDWLLDIYAADNGALDKLIESLEPLAKGRRFGAQTHSQKAAKFLRSKAPQWVFAADSPSILRLKIFQNLFLENSMDFWPDFVITSGNHANPERLDKKNVRELQRRHKRIVWDFDASEGTDPAFPIQGVVTGRTSEALERFKRTE